MLKKLSSISSNASFMKYFRNTSWMFVERALKMIAGVFVGIYVARYLGPESFGLLSYALAIVAIFMVICKLGMDSILVREIASYPDLKQDYMGTAFGLMLIGALVAMSIISILINYVESDFQIKLYVLIISIGLLFQSFSVVDYAFQAQVKAKYSSIAKSIALIVSSAIKIYLVFIKASLLSFVIAYVVDQILIALFLMLVHFRLEQLKFFTSFKRSLVIPLLKSVWPMVLAALSGILYMRVDQIMIKNMLDAEQLGLYVAASKVYEAWVVIPFILSISLLPAIVKLKSSSIERYERNLTRLFAFLFWVGVIVALITTIFSKLIITITFGSAYESASTVFAIVMWTAAFTAIGAVTARYLTVEKMEKKIAFRTFVAFIINLILNIILIPKYGIEGAAIATLVCILVANYFIDFTDVQLMQLVRIKNRAIFLGLFNFRKL